MAIYILAAATDRPLGSRDGATFQRCGKSFAIRKRNVPVQKRTARQSQVKNRLSSVASTWRNLDSTEQDSFIDETPTYPRIDSLGNPYELSGINLRNSSNAQLSLAELPLIDLMPVSSPPATPVLDFTVINFNLSLLTVAANPNISPANRTLKVFISAPINQVPATPSLRDTKLIANFNDGVDSNVDIFGLYSAAWGTFTPGDNRTLLIGLQYVDESTGQQSGIFWFGAAPIF